MEGEIEKISNSGFGLTVFADEETANEDHFDASVAIGGGNEFAIGRARSVGFRRAVVLNGLGDSLSFFGRKVVANFCIFAEKFGGNNFMTVAINMFAKVVIGGDSIN